jgi:hypothetical protein
MSRVTDDRVTPVSLWQPQAADILFLVIVLLALRLGQSALLNDPGTPWHIRVGQDVWRHGPPTTDTYSYTRGGEHWVSQSWLFDAVLVVIYEHWSWNGVVVASAIMLGWVYRFLFRLVLDAPANIAWSAALTLLAAACGAGHWLARPHLVSLLLLVLTFRWCIAFHRSGSVVVWAVPLLMVLWCNVHGAFLAGFVVIACSLVGQIVSPPSAGSVWKRIVVFALVLCVAVAATLLNPYGVGLHAHLGDLLFSSGVRDLIDEWRAPDFQAADARPLEMLLLLAFALFAVGATRLDYFSLLHFIVWIHFALLAVRQVAFAGIIAAPVLAELTGGVWLALRARWNVGFADRWVEELDRRAREWAAEERTARWPLWSIAISVALFGATALNVQVPALGIGTAAPSSARWPWAAMAKLNSEPPSGRLFNDLNWGGFVILNADPPREVFADDRFELYGREFIKQYLDALQYGPGWKKLLEQYDFEFALIRPDVPLARILSESSDWSILHRDGTALLLRRREAIRVTER